MTKYRDILRLSALGLSLREIERSIHVSRKTIIKVQRGASELSIAWLIDESVTDCILSIGNPQKEVRTFSWTIYQSMSAPHYLKLSGAR